MAAIVPAHRAEPDEAEIRIGAGPSASDTWLPLANLGNWLRGTGAQIVAGNSPAVDVAASTTRAFRYRTKPRSSAIQRIWVFQISTDATVPVTVSVRSPASSGTAVVYTVPRGRDSRYPFVYTQTLAAKTSTEAEISIDFTPSSGGLCTVESVACYEQTRPVLNKDATDLGADVETVRPGQPIRDANNESLAAIHDLVTGADARRVAIHHWAVPEESALTRVTASDLAVYSLPVPVLAPLLTSGATTGTVYWSCYAKVSAGAGCAIKVSTDGSAVNDSTTVTSTSFVWSTARAISIDCDDLSVADGRRSARFDGLQVTYAGDGTNTVSLAGISVWVDSVA